MGQESVCPETSYWKVMKTAVDGDRLVLHLIPVRAWVSCPYMRGAQLTNSQPLPAPGFGLAVVQLAGAVDCPSPALLLRQPGV